MRVKDFSGPQTQLKLNISINKNILQFVKL